MCARRFDLSFLKFLFFHLFFNYFRFVLSNSARCTMQWAILLWDKRIRDQSPSQAALPDLLRLLKPSSFFAIWLKINNAYSWKIKVLTCLLCYSINEKILLTTCFDIWSGNCWARTRQRMTTIIDLNPLFNWFELSKLINISGYNSPPHFALSF